MKDQNQGSSSNINVSKHAGNVEAQHTDIVVEVLPENTAKGNYTSNQVAKTTYSSNLNKSCLFITAMQNMCATDVDLCCPAIFFFFVEVTGCEDLAAQFRGSSNSSHRESGFHGIM